MVTKYDLMLEEVERSTVTILGEDYILAQPDDYSMPVIKQINRMWKEINEWDQKETLTAKEGEEYEKHLNALVKYVCPDLPKDVWEHPNFGRTDKTALVIAFLLAVAAESTPLKPRVTPTPDSSTADSNDSMEETSTTGLTSPSET